MIKIVADFFCAIQSFPSSALRYCVISDLNDPFQIVDVNLTSEGKTKIEVGMTLTFTYQVRNFYKGSSIIHATLTANA